MITHTITITYEEYEDTDENFEPFKEKFLKFLKDNPSILKEDDECVENGLREEFYPEDMLKLSIEGDEENLKDHTIGCIYDDIGEYQRNSIDNLFDSDAYKEMLKKARQLLCPAPTSSNE